MVMVQLWPFRKGFHAHASKKRAWIINRRGKRKLYGLDKLIF
jgi:hypothetical protein